MKRENIELQETIGEGEFGEVVRGYATNILSSGGSAIYNRRNQDA